MKKRALTALTVIAVAATVTFAQQPCAGCPSEGAHKGMGAPGAEMAAPAPTPNIPDLTEAQQAKLDNARVTHIRAVLPIRADIEVAEMELGALWRAEKLDGKAILAKARQLSDLRGKLGLAEVDHRLAVAQVLTPEQRKAMGPGMGHGRRGMGRGMMRRMMMPGMMGGCPGGGGCHDAKSD